jgi:mannose-6-phosphate isomerase-like protein (cupin superfamily)
MYGKTFNELNTKKNIKFFKSNNYKVAQIFDENEYSLFKIILKKNSEIEINEKNFLLVCGIENKNIYSAFIKKKTRVNYNFSRVYYLCFQKKKKNINLIDVRDKKKKLLNLRIKRNTKNLNKYWGEMYTLLENNRGSVKLIHMLNKKQSSMEFHINKKESYLICSGKIKLGLRYARANQKSLILNRNDTFLMKPGTMHMRMSLKDSFILEMSTKDEDNDSIIVEDGLKYKFHDIR